MGPCNMGELRQVLSHSGKLALLLTAIAFLVSIVLFAGPWWYHSSATGFTLGLFKYKNSLLGIEMTGNIRDDSLGESTNDVVRAANVAIACFILAWAVTIVYFVTAVLHITGKSFGPLDRTKLGIINFVLTLVITLLYIIVLVTYPWIFNLEDYIDDTYYWSYYLMIPVTILVLLATVLNACSVSGSTYSPIK